jgi:hypothetical protein
MVRNLARAQIAQLTDHYGGASMTSARSPFNTSPRWCARPIPRGPTSYCVRHWPKST